MSKSDYLETAICNWIKGTTMPAAPAAVYVALFNGDPLDTGAGGSEVTTTIRVAGRVAVAFGSISGGGLMSNSGIVNFGNAAGAATVTHFAVYDAASTGNLLGSGALTGGSQSIGAGVPVSFAIGSLTWNED